MEIQKSHVMDWVLEDTSDCELINYSQWRSEATTPGWEFTCKFHILPTNSILLVNLPTIFNKLTDRTCSFNDFIDFIDHNRLLHNFDNIRVRSKMLCTNAWR